ncbi:MAG: 23S rRNA (adenine(2503)-C(2))-methyltransferase RlmN [Thermodesulfobacteriota bacterium]|nr:MAG: 23S rRNA (adenine(2503)-C(2))-methyltransferase RlmN [Thermodesulfobacteriota bacterium]
MIKPNLRNYNIEELKKLMETLGEPSYRGEQIFHWITCKNAITFEEMTDLPKTLRAKFSEKFSLELPEILDKEEDIDGTTKFALKLADGSLIETVIIPERDHYTLCVSTQVGCPIGCKFCITGKLGFKRNLEVSEILSQVVLARRYLKEKNEILPLRNIVFMGMGEPLLNLQNLIKALKILAHSKGFNYSRKRLTVSTVGLLKEMKILAKEFPVALALSLHAPTDEIRKKLIPVAKKYPIKELISACKKFPRIKNSRITIEYVLIRNVNDGEECAVKLAELLKGYPFKVNLIPYNPHSDLPFERPSPDKIEKFQKYLLSQKILTTVRKSKGLMINAACGQLGAKFLKYSIPDSMYRKTALGTS